MLSAHSAASSIVLLLAIQHIEELASCVHICSSHHGWKLYKEKKPFRKFQRHKTWVWHTLSTPVHVM